MKRPRLIAILAAVAAIATATFGLVAAAAPAQASTHTTTSASSPYAGGTVQTSWATFYGWYDNTPPGCATAYGGCAGGVGTYADPITFATDTAEVPKNGIIYYPSVHKYFKMQDDCTECDQDWRGQGPDGGPHMWHFDLWLGGKGGNAMDAIDCEDGLTLQTTAGKPVNTDFVLNPPKNLPVSSAPLFNPKTNKCFEGVTPSTTTGYYQNVATKTCLDTASAKVGLTKCSATPPAEEYTYNGAFLSQKNTCFSEVGAGFGMPTCNGFSKQQWEINLNQTFVNMNSNRCVATSGTGSSAKLVLTRPNCTSAPAADKWVFTETSSTPGVPLKPVTWP